ncbi:MAG: inositol monophosphatase family protein [Thermodesulfobacteriota bacterium]
MNYFNTAVKAARESGKILLDSIGKIKVIELKAKNDLVTEIDILSENSIVDIIKSSFPEHTILAEEGGLSDNNSEFKWLIDPLDGTMNYAHSYPFFSVSIALELCGKLILGVVYDPVKDELFTAESGKGAFLNGEPIATSNTDKLENCLLSTGFLHEDESLVEINLKHFSDFIWKARGVRRDGSAALDLCYVACGRYDGFWELGLHAWDVAAGSLIIEEAGGTVTDMAGGNFSAYGGEIVASNSLIHTQMSDLLNIK